MIQGMTGFGSADKEGFRVEIRSLNHRFMDISMKLPAQLMRHEIALRNILKERFRRGKFEVFVSVTEKTPARLAINRPLVKEIYSALSSLKEEFSLKGDITVETISTWKDLIIEEAREYDTKPLYEAFREAVRQLEDMRIKEGAALEEDISARLSMLESMNEGIASALPASLESSKRRFMEKVKGFAPEVQLSDAALLEEACTHAQRADISEEVTRIRSHVGQMKKILSGDDTIGKGLDFLLQELGREANTIAAKTDDLGVLDIAVRMKSEIERAREQAQNIQ